MSQLDEHTTTTMIRHSDIGKRCYGGAFKKGNDAWLPKGQRHRWNLQLMSHDQGNFPNRAPKGLSKRRAKAAILNWCRH